MDRSTKAVALIQADMGSVRLPGKVLREIAGVSLVERVVERVRMCTLLDEVVVLTSDSASDEPLRSYLEWRRIPAYAGSSELSALDRYFQAASEIGADPVVRISADRPFVDPAVVDGLIDRFLEDGLDYIAVAAGSGALGYNESYPSGLDAECFSYAALERAWREATTPGDREHVTSYLWRTGLFATGSLTTGGPSWGHIRLTVDTPADLLVANVVYATLGQDERRFGLDEIIELFESCPSLADLNYDPEEPVQYLSVRTAA